MSVQYDEYLEQHKSNVRKGYEWFRDNMPELLVDIYDIDYAWQIGVAHDASKDDPEEYASYDRYFYGKNRSYQVVQDFNVAWLKHQNKNPHHWQFWVLINDDPNKDIEALDMPYNYILEMICDWWAFSWKSGNLYEIFKWYDEHKDYMKLSDKTRKTVDDILEKLRKKLDESAVD